MRGIIFTEYMDFVVARIGDEVVDAILLDLEGRITGAYTSVGNYSFDEFAILHGRIVEHMGVEGGDLAFQFGYVLMARFRVIFPDYFEGVKSGLGFLEKVSIHIHEEVKKLYPDSNPPDISIKHKDGNPSELIYRSHRPLAPVAHGMASACLEDFGDPYRIGKATTTGDTTTFELVRL